MTDQVAEYRKLMDERFKERNSTDRLEEERRKSEEMLKVDEEIALKLQAQYDAQQYRPPVYFPVSERLPETTHTDPVIVRDGCLPEVTDKCFGINTQVCVLATVGTIAISLLVIFIIFATN